MYLEMNFDFDYVTKAAEESGSLINPDWKLIAIIAGAVVLTAAIVCLIIILAKKGKKPKMIIGEGNVFCRKCLNEYDAGLAKCPYCKTKKF